MLNSEKGERMKKELERRLKKLEKGLKVNSEVEFDEELSRKFKALSDEDLERICVFSGTSGLDELYERMQKGENVNWDKYRLSSKLPEDLKMVETKIKEAEEKIPEEEKRVISTFEDAFHLLFEESLKGEKSAGGKEFPGAFWYMYKFDPELWIKFEKLKKKIKFAGEEWRSEILEKGEKGKK